MSVQNYTISFLLQFEKIGNAPLNIEPAIIQLIEDTLTPEMIDAFQYGFQIEVSYDSYEKLGEIKYKEKLEKLLLSIENLCIDYEQAQNQFKKL